MCPRIQKMSKELKNCEKNPRKFAKFNKFEKRQKIPRKKQNFQVYRKNQENIEKHSFLENIREIGRAHV